MSFFVLLPVLNTISLLQMADQHNNTSYYGHPQHSGQPLPPQQQPPTSYGGAYPPQPTQQQPPPPPPTFQPGWGCAHSHPWEYSTPTPQAPPRAAIGEANPKKRALEPEEEGERGEGDAGNHGPNRSRGRGRGRAGRGGHLWGWLRMGYYKSKPPFPSCFAHKRENCGECYEWVTN